MSLNRRSFLATSFCLPHLASAAQRWLDRKPAEWTPDDIQTVLNRSAWVREAPIGIDLSSGGRKPPKQGTQQTELFRILVRWESGLPVRLARHTATLPDAGIDHYVISVSRLPLSFLAGVLGKNERDAATRAEIASELAKTVRIERFGKEPIRAAAAQWIDSDFSERVSITFPPGETPIQLSDTEASVVGYIRSMRFHATFPLKPMVYKGKLEL